MNLIQTIHSGLTDMHRGYVKVWRKIEESGLIQMPNTLAFFMHILLNAAYKDKKVGTTTGVIDLKRGQFISGINKLSSTLSQTVRQIRTSQDRLVKLGILSVESTNRYSIYTIENYSNYQDSDTLNDMPAPNKRQTKGKQTTTKQESNNSNIKEKDTTPLELLESVGIPLTLAKEWLKIRKSKSLILTESALHLTIDEATKANMTLEQAIKISCGNSWGGFKASWITNMDAGRGNAAGGNGAAHIGMDDNTLTKMAKDLGISAEGLSRQALVSKINAKKGIK